MSDVAYDVAKYLADNGFGTLGTDIHIGYMPSSDAGVSVERAGGQMGRYTPINETVVNIYVKNTSASEAMTTIENIKNFIHRMHNTALQNSYTYSMLVIGDVEDVQRDPEYSKIFKITVQLINRDVSVIS